MLYQVVALKMEAAACDKLTVYYASQGFNLNRAYCQDKKKNRGAIILKS
jgi:hypothetical protein